jgi:hypothetical protein
LSGVPAHLKDETHARFWHYLEDWQLVRERAAERAPELPRARSPAPRQGERYEPGGKYSTIETILEWGESEIVSERKSSCDAAINERLLNYGVCVPLRECREQALALAARDREAYVIIQVCRRARPARHIISMVNQTVSIVYVWSY